jgi:hypothetical protein
MSRPGVRASRFDMRMRRPGVRAGCFGMKFFLKHPRRTADEAGVTLNDI